MPRIIRRAITDAALIGVIAASTYVIYQSPLGNSPTSSVTATTVTEQSENLLPDPAPETTGGDPGDAPLDPDQARRVSAPMNAPVPADSHDEAVVDDESVIGGIWDDIRDLANQALPR